MDKIMVMDRVLVMVQVRVMGRGMDAIIGMVKVMEIVAMKMPLIYAGALSPESISWAGSRVSSRSWSWSFAWAWSWSWSGSMAESKSWSESL